MCIRDRLSITYNSGIQGTANAVYNMYVTDLNFAAGHNISDVQGIMISDVGAGTGDNAQGANAAVGFADIEGTPALQESNRNKFLIPIGRKAIKQYNIAGDTDTAYVARDVFTSATMSTGGVISFNIPSTTGSTNQPNEQGNPIGDTLESNLIVTARANVESANSGHGGGTTITVTAVDGSNFLLLNTGTANTIFKEGDLLKVFMTSNNQTMRVIGANTTGILMDKKASPSKATWVDFPMPSPPSNVMNLPLDTG